MNTEVKSQKQIKPKVNEIVFLGEKNNWRIYMSVIQSTSSPNRYYQTKIMLHKSGALKFQCSCKAGKNNYLCKHVSALYNSLIRRDFKVEINLNS